jgi:Fe-S cluster biogenesis protein NfuA
MDANEKNNIIRRINESLDKIRPYLISDGGDVQFKELTDDMKVIVKLIGACDHCPFSVSTLKAGVEQAIIQDVPEITEVEAV